eukprot:270328-Rhodomonas_salina.2
MRCATLRYAGSSAMFWTCLESVGVPCALCGTEMGCGIETDWGVLSDVGKRACATGCLAVKQDTWLRQAGFCYAICGSEPGHVTETGSKLTPSRLDALRQACDAMRGSERALAAGQESEADGAPQKKWTAFGEKKTGTDIAYAAGCYMPCPCMRLAVRSHAFIEIAHADGRATGYPLEV